jgi:hypothetical protein
MTNRSPIERSILECLRVRFSNTDSKAEQSRSSDRSIESALAWPEPEEGLATAFGRVMADEPDDECP